MITVDTKLVALLGTPLRQSFSTRMQNAAFRKYGVDMEYFPIESGPEDLEAIISAVRHMNFAGLGVTKPCKQAVIRYLDGLDELAEKMGAVNTIVCKDGKLIGYNTDGKGCVRAVKEAYGGDLREAALLCLGAGGSGSAVCCTFASAGVKKLYITDVRAESAQKLVSDINEKFAPVAEYVPFSDGALCRTAAECGIIMNHTGVGMAPHTEKSPVSRGVFREGMLAFDATYNPARTQFLKDAESCGCRVLNGLGMLVYQGAYQFELWTGRENPAECMFGTVSEIMAEKQKDVR